MNQKPIVLIGYMGSGKSTIGRLLAHNINYKFIDLDHYIEKIESKTIPEIFKRKGEIYFRSIEFNTLSDILEQEKQVVVSLGGGTPCFHNAMKIIRNATPNSFYLKVSVRDLTERLFPQRRHRPMIEHLKSIDEMHEFIGKHLFERNQFYMQAEHTVLSEQHHISSTINSILEKLA